RILYGCCSGCLSQNPAFPHGAETVAVGCAVLGQVHLSAHRVVEKSSYHDYSGMEGEWQALLLSISSPSDQARYSLSRSLDAHRGASGNPLGVLSRCASVASLVASRGQFAHARPTYGRWWITLLAH